VERTDFRLGGVAGDAGLEAGDDPERLGEHVFTIVQPGLDLRLHRERHPEIGRLSDELAEEARRGHADNGDGGSVEGEGLAQHLRVAGEAVLPEGVAHDGDGVGAGLVIVRRGEQVGRWRRPRPALRNSRPRPAGC
jgi:hypothetical protein